ncbi:CrcB family protein [Periweissella cryptocerci]|uniref:Fluoride-specific ion channel FluC n=1 Tax=Periweissella cryptocerci TaxID=2506420 RepID=A0A4V1AIN0_9LACO|nr:CrcB family protein [Periweissella cryptocerci]QBO36075.1 CrcB family protein [Periweissella cryptocerci]
MLQKSLAVLIGGFIGGALREAIELIISVQQFPVATLIINLIGAFFLGYLNFMIAKKWAMPTAVATGLTTGVIGAFTTFSTFMLDFNHLVTVGHLSFALTYLIISVMGGLMFARLGMRVGMHA